MQDSKDLGSLPFGNIVSRPTKKKKVTLIAITCWHNPQKQWATSAVHSPVFYMSSVPGPILYPFVLFSALPFLHVCPYDHFCMSVPRPPQVCMSVPRLYVYLSLGPLMFECLSFGTLMSLSVPKHSLYLYVCTQAPIMFDCPLVSLL